MMQDNPSPQAICALSCHWFCSINILFLLLLLCVQFHNSYFVYFSVRRDLRTAAFLSEKPLIFFFCKYCFQFRSESSECTCSINNEICINCWPSHKYHSISDSQPSHILDGNASVSAEGTVLHLTWWHTPITPRTATSCVSNLDDSELQGQKKC